MKLAPAFLFLGFCWAMPALGYVDEGHAPLVVYSAYKPTYFVAGKNDAKLQLSFKARPAEAIPFYLAYSQLMLWDVYRPSAPMRDINFNPEAFYRWQFGESDSPRWLDFGPFEHESNGKDGAASRSWNRTYVRFSDVVHFSDSARRLQWSLKLWVPYSCEGGDCGTYRGIGELNVSLENPFGTSFGDNDLSLRLYPGGPHYVNPTKGAQELTLRMRPSKKTFLPLIVVQLFHGYGENMLNQDQEQLALRAGFGF